MRRVSLAALTLIVVLGAAASSGCSKSTSAPAMDNASQAWGYVAAPARTQLEVSADQIGAEQLVVRRVLVPTAGWVVVNTDVNGKPGDQVGLVSVKSGESLNVNVPIQNLTTPKVIVSLWADRGTPGAFDFDPMNKSASADRPFLVNGAPLASEVAIRQFGIPVDPSQVSIVASDQVGATNKLTISQVRSPSAGWLVVRLQQQDGQGQRIGLLHVNSGETTNAVVTLDPLLLTNNLLVSLYADRGQRGIFEYDPADPLGSIDQPYYVNGVEYSVPVRVR